MEYLPIPFKSKSVAQRSEPFVSIQHIMRSIPSSGDQSQPFCPVFVQICPLMGLGPDPPRVIHRRRATVTFRRLLGSGPAQFQPAKFLFLFLKIPASI
jgi:hypothetical protein